MLWNILKHTDSCKISMEIMTEIAYNLRRKKEQSKFLKKKLYTNTFTKYK